jgi:hypothetical protein
MRREPSVLIKGLDGRASPAMAGGALSVMMGLWDVIVQPSSMLW